MGEVRKSQVIFSLAYSFFCEVGFATVELRNKSRVHLIMTVKKVA